MAGRSNLADLHGFSDLHPHVSLIGARTNANGREVYAKPRRSWTWPEGDGSREPAARMDANSWLLVGASLLLAALAVAMGITSFHAQFAYVFATKHQRLPSMLEALGLDAGAVIFSMLGIALARLGRRAVVERVLVVACALGSCGMNALNANLGSPRSVAVWALPPVLFALTSDRLVAVIRRAALGRLADDEAQRSAWQYAGRAFLYALRFVVAPPSTAKGARQALLNATPLPELPAPARKAISAPAQPQGKTPAALAIKPASKPRARKQGRRSGPTKTQRLIDLVAERHGPLADFSAADVSKVATALGPEVGLHPGSARTALKAAVLAAQNGSQP